MFSRYNLNPINPPSPQAAFAYNGTISDQMASVITDDEPYHLLIPPRDNRPVGKFTPIPNKPQVKATATPLINTGDCSKSAVTMSDNRTKYREPIAFDWTMSSQQLYPNLPPSPVRANQHDVLDMPVPDSQITHSSSSDNANHEPTSQLEGPQRNCPTICPPAYTGRLMTPQAPHFGTNPAPNIAYSHSTPMVTPRVEQTNRPNQNVQTTRSYGNINIPMSSYDGLVSSAAITWLRKYERFGRIHNKSNEELCELFPMFITSKALDWFETSNCRLLRTWEEVRRAFLNKYEPNSIRLLTKTNDLMDRKQKIGESFEEFLLTTRREATIVGRNNDAFIRDVVLKNARPQIKQFILTRPYKQLADIIESAEIAEATEIPELQSVDTLLSAINNLSLQVDQLTEISEQQTKQSINAVDISSYLNPDGSMGTPAFQPNYQQQQFPQSTAQRQQWGTGNSASFQQPRVPFRQPASRQMGTPADNKNQPAYRCKGCGYMHVHPRECRNRALTCFLCNRVGHVARNCLYNTSPRNRNQ